MLAEYSNDRLAIDPRGSFGQPISIIIGPAQRLAAGPPMFVALKAFVIGLFVQTVTNGPHHDPYAKRGRGWTEPGLSKG